MSPSLNREGDGSVINNGMGSRTRLISQASVLSQPDLLSPDELFTQYTVHEIQRNHKKILRDIESKKGELRTMVGERYRELIDTADTIARMEDTVKSIQSTLRSIESSCKLECTTSVEAEAEHNKKEEFWSIASQMKLLVDIPEKIWNAMEKKQFLIAGQLYLLSRHIVTNLHISAAGGTCSQLLTQFPVLPQQWGAISHFKSSILQGCRDVLGGVEVTDEQFTDCICTIILLEGANLADLLQEFLDTRRAASSQHLTASGSTVTNQLANCVTSIRCTIHMLYNNVISENHVSNRLHHLCNKVSTIEVITVAFQQDSSLQSITRHLPTLVHSYHPTINSSLEIPDIRNMCEEWCDGVVTLISNTLHHTLRYINSVSSVANLTKTYCRSKSTQDGQWELACEGVLDKQVNIWEDILMKPVNNHVNSIIENYVRDALQATNSDIAESLVSPVQAGDVMWDNNGNHDSLGLKTEGYTTHVYKTCNSLNDRLSFLYQDIISYTGAPRDKTRHNKENHTQSEEIFAHMRDITHKYLAELASFIVQTVPESEEVTDECADKLAVLIQMCRCIVQHTPTLSTLLTSQNFKPPADVYQCIEQAKSSLLSRYGIWLACSLSQHLSELLSSKSEVFFAMAWEDVTIKEESEDGKNVESTSSLPIYTSSYITGILYTLCNQVYRLGCHGYSHGDMCMLLGQLHGHMVAVYDEWLENGTDHVTQNMALQYWFDFKYLSTLLNVSSTVGSDLNKKVNNITRRIENHIDPFDWDVFQPHLTSNVHSLMKRTYSLYSCVSRYSLTTQAITAASTTRHSVQQNTHNILEGNGLVQRFSLLPVRYEDELENEDENTSSDLSLLRNLSNNLLFFTSPTGSCNQ